MRIVTRILTGFLFVMIVYTHLLIVIDAVETPAVNVALNKPITAELTCGTPVEPFYGHRQINLPAEDRMISTCDSTNSTLAHQADLMVDLDVDSNLDTGYTWWQSTSLNKIRNSDSGQLDVNSGLDAVITVDLTDLHYVESVSIQMGDSVRPTQMAILKSVNGIDFTYFAYKVSNMDECQSKFQVTPSTAINSLDGVLCAAYSRTQLPRNEVITFELITLPNLRPWQQTRYVRFHFYNMPQEFGLFANNFHHYTVRNIQVLAPCQCNAHARECVLMPSMLDETKMTYQCVCEDNTQGLTCSECLLFYNQLPYEKGTNGFQCEECNCFGHSDECYYDVNVGNLNASINANDDLYGGGVCVNCNNNTAGFNCHECEVYSYRPATKQQTDEDACQPCACHLPGTREDPSIGLAKGECVVSNDIALPPGMLPGDCFCKANVEGMTCDVCKDGFYDLTDANPNGCLSCNCFTSGTVNGSNACDKGSLGQCSCKTNTVDRRCDQCRDGYYGLTADSVDGCTACSCDIGAAVSPACHKIDGQCVCRNNIDGRNCDSVATLSYYSTLHEISAEFESVGHDDWERDDQMLPGYRWFGYVVKSGTTSTSTSLTVPTSQLSGSFQLTLRVATDGPTQVDVTISPVGNTEGTSQEGAADLPYCPSWCSQSVSLGGSATTFDLQPGQWSVELQINTQGGANVYLDYVVAIPEEFLNPTDLLGAEQATKFTTMCDVITNDMKFNMSEESICISAVYSLSTYYFNGGKACNCELMGSLDNNCEPYGGQCRCKPGVGGRRCDTCLPEYYNFRSTGCTACECFTANKVCDMTTGQCPCPLRTAGRRCDRCVTYAWGLDEINGCQACNCHHQGSISSQCDLQTGNCDCKPGVGTQTCSICDDEFKLLSDQGCQPCGCSIAGSHNTVCNKTNGQCSCKENTGGLTCNDCAEGTFFNSPTQSQGCLECICMGITSQCTSSRARSVQYSIPTDAAYVSNWELLTVTSLSDNPSSAIPSTSVLNGKDFVTVPVQIGAALHWKVPDLSGNQLGLYGSLLMFSLFYLLDANQVNPREQEIQVIIKGMGNRYVHILGTNSVNNITEFFIQITEEEWRMDNPTYSRVSRGDFLRTLVNVDSVLVTAQLNSVAHQSSIGGVQYSRATGSSSPVFDPSAPYASTVEVCACGPGYIGSSCEECATGYYRNGSDTHPYFGTCVPCECNSHSTECDQTTGECLGCQHNAQGVNCEQCALGYYGDATMGTAFDCTQCPCSLPKTLNAMCELIDNEVTCTSCAPGHLGPLCDSCAEFHYGQPKLPGGSCTPCECTGNSNECDTVTGQCLNCQGGTTGDNCERCNVMTYGNASQQNCQSCSCDLTGALNILCDHATGQCPCKPGVDNRVCDVCVENFFGFGNEGCTDCACNVFGSVQLQCDSAGSCICLAGVEGDKCDRCEARSFGLPLQACAQCDCDATGTVGGVTSLCDSVSGQCLCKPGVAGRQCNMCELGFVDLTAAGCTKCDKCVETLLNSTFDLGSTWTEVWSLASMVGQLQEKDLELQQLEPESNRTAQQLADMINSYSVLRTDIQQINQQQYYTDVNNLLNRIVVDYVTFLQTWIVSGKPIEVPQKPITCPLGENYFLCAMTQGEITLNQTLSLLEESEKHIQRITELQMEAQLNVNGAAGANATALVYNEILTSWVATATQLYESADPRIQLILQTSFDNQHEAMQAELERSQNVSSQSTALIDVITAQALECNHLVSLVNTAEGSVSDIQQLVDSINQDETNINAMLEEITIQINNTQYLLTYSAALIDEATETLEALGAILGAAQSDIIDGNKVFADSVEIHVGNNHNDPIPVVDPGLIENSPDLNGWVNGEITARNAINNVEINIANIVSTQVDQAETKSDQLDADAQQIVTIFQGVQTDGQTGALAIQMYKDTMTVMEEAIVTSQQALTTLIATQTYLAGRTVEAIQQAASDSKQTSVDLRSLVNLRSTDVQGLDILLSTANQTLMDAEELWRSIEIEQAILLQQAVTLSDLSEDPQIQPAIDQGTSNSSMAITQSGQILIGLDQLQTSLQQDREDIETLQETTDNGTQHNTGLPDVVSNTEAELTDLEGKVNSLQSIQIETAQLRTNITSKMDALREKLRLAQERIANTKQPVHFSGQSSLSITRQADEPATLFNELQLDVKADQRDGLLFFVENPETNAFFSLEIITSYLVFKFNVRADMVAIQSPIDVCCGEWYRARATRYEDEGQLSVVKLSSGGASVNHNSSINTYDHYLTFPETGTTFFVGGLPQNYRTAKALSTDFEGCIANVIFDNQAFNLWRPDSLEGSTSCCEGPQLPDVPQGEIIPGMGFTGFGYLEVHQHSFDVYNNAGVSFKFRTFMRDAVLFLVARVDLISYIGIYVNDGKLVYEMTTSGNAKYTITSEENYNDALWYQVLVSYNESFYNLDIYNASDNSNGLLESFTRRTLAPLRFSNLQYSPKIILGAHISALPLAPGTQLTPFNHGPNRLPFAGAVDDFMLSNGTLVEELVPRLLTNETAKQYLNVRFSGVMAHVVPGIGFKGQYAYAKLKIPDMLRLTQSLSFSFKTFEPNGLLAYSYDGQTFNKLFYIALYHGNIFLQYNIGEGRSEPVQTRSLRLNTGQWQTVSISFNGISASLKVNDLPTIYGNRQIPTGGIPITAANSYLYVGGVPITTPVLIGGEFPVRQSLNSGIKDFAVNGVYLNFNDPEVVIAHQGMDLSGVTPEVTTLPIIPFPTKPPSEVVPVPTTCSAPVPLVYYQSQVVRLGELAGGYMAFDLDQITRQNFLNSFVVTMEFRTVSSNGLLFFAADNSDSPSQFVVLTLVEGKLSFSIMTNSRATNGLNINSNEKYDDGYWHEVVALRINDFAAILVQETRDYANNGVLSNSVTSLLTISTSFYVGGLEPGIVTNNILTVRESFDGCIKRLDISFTDAAGLSFNFDNPTVSQGVTQCVQNEVEPGASFLGTGSWIQLENNFVVSTSVDVRILVRTTAQRSALLFAVSASAQNFFAIDIYDGNVRVAISHGSQAPYIVRSTWMSSLYDICDGRPHEIVVRFSSNQLELVVDGKMDVTLFTPGTPIVNTNNPLYIGGVPDPNVISIGGLSTESFLGCIQSLTINAVQRNLRDHISSAQIITGCPLPHP